jgi:GNAT superfamily N-acetyltransferase
VIIRPARPEEADALSRLCVRSKAYWGYDPAFMALAGPAVRVRSEWIERGNVLVAGDEPLAVSAITRSEGDEWDLALFFVDPPAMGKGVGRALFGATADLARRRGAKSLFILSDPGGAAFYMRMGAVRLGEAPSDAIPGRMLPTLRFSLSIEEDSDFWLRFARRMSDAVLASGDNNIRFLFIDSFVPGSVTSTLERGLVLATVFVDEGGGKHFQYGVSLHLGSDALRACRAGAWSVLLDQTEVFDRLVVNRRKKKIQIEFT